VPSTIISAEGLGKRYLIRHEQREPYVALRDVLAEGARTFVKRILAPSSIIASGTVREEFWALRDVSFDVKEGDRVGIIGRNGAGKSTLLKLLSRITEPTEGRITLRGRVSSLLEVGTGFHPELTGRENIALNGAILGMTRAEIRRRFDEIVDFAEIEKFLDTPVKRYSSGMYMRLAFSVAAHLEPDVFIVDEVLAVGDVEFQRKCIGKMQEIGRADRTIIFVSHNMSAIASLCTRCIRLDHGRVVQVSGDVDAVIKGYLEQDGSTESVVWKRVDATFDNPWFSPLRLSVGALEEDKRPPFDSADDIVIEIEARVERLDPALTVGYALYTSEGQCLYWSYQTDDSPDRWPQLEVGINILQSRVPRGLLNEGEYRIELIGGLHYREWLFEPRKLVPTISFSVSGVRTTSPYWSAKRPTLLAPVTSWKARR